ncbi:MAG: OmpA family protein [Candidatus Aminicenantes bacterium]|nr:OmpA family protein [Candidatus Aminicenantes bacterium]
MKKTIFFITFTLFILALAVNAQEAKKIYNLQKTYIYLEEALLISDSDLNCSYFIKDSMPQDIRIEAAYKPVDLRNDFSDQDSLIVSQGAKDGLKVGDQLMIISQGKSIRGLGRYFLKKSLAEVTNVEEHTAVIQLKTGCHPVNIGDFAVPFKPEPTVFAKKIDYLLARIPANTVKGKIMYTDLSMGIPASISSTSQYVTVDLGQGVVAKGTFLLICRNLKDDLPPLIVGLAIVIQAENTNSTVKILDVNMDVRVNDSVLILPAGEEKTAAATEKKESIPVVDALQIEGQEKENANAQPAETQPAEAAGDTLKVDIFFDFASKQPKGDHSADFTAIKDFIAAKSEYLVTLRGYTCSIGNEEYNLRLAKERVETVKSILVSHYGVDAAHVESFLYGEKEPLIDKSSEAERQKNPQVKIEVSGK